MDQPPERNETEFVTHTQLLLDKDGEKLLSVVKATFEWAQAAGRFELAAKQRQRAVRFADIPWGDPEKSSIAYPADLSPRKPGTDVVVVAKAYAPGGSPVPSFDAHVHVGTLRKTVRVFGLRVWEAGGMGLSPPRPVSEVELRYDYAWGGCDDSDPSQFVEEPRNPVGMGVARDPKSLTHQVAPCLEDPEFPIVTHRSRPPPAGMGVVGRHWEPRRHYVGTYDQAWKETRCPLPPADEDPRLHLFASPGLIAAPPLKGGEECGLLNLLPGGGALKFTLPQIALEIEFEIRGRSPTVLRPYLDTVLIDLLDTGPHKPVALELVWRALAQAPRKLKDSLTIVRDLPLLHGVGAGA